MSSFSIPKIFTLPGRLSAPGDCYSLLCVFEHDASSAILGIRVV